MHSAVDRRADRFANFGMQAGILLHALRCRHRDTVGAGSGRNPAGGMDLRVDDRRGTGLCGDAECVDKAGLVQSAIEAD